MSDGATFEEMVAKAFEKLNAEFKTRRAALSEPAVEAEQRCAHGKTVSQECRLCTYDELLPDPEPSVEANTHVHGPLCRRDDEGPTIWWLCGHEPRNTPRFVLDSPATEANDG